jgi:four helix bundle protein
LSDLSDDFGRLEWSCPVAQSFRELIVWQRALDLSVAVYQLSKAFPREDLYGLTSQIRRAAFSVPSNIAEGQGRGSVGEFRQFLCIARGSNFELQTQLAIARALNLGDPTAIDQAESLSHEVGKMLYGMLESLQPARD